MAQCKPCHASGTDCRDNGKCCDKSTTCYWKNEHWADCKASCNRGTFDPNSPVEHRAPWSCHPWGTFATPAVTGEHLTQTVQSNTGLHGVAIPGEPVQHP